jgi:hypothetical protein
MATLGALIISDLEKALFDGIYFNFPDIFELFKSPGRGF